LILLQLRSKKGFATKAQSHEVEKQRFPFCDFVAKINFCKKLE